MKRSWLYLGGILVLLIIATVLVLQKPGEQSITGTDVLKLVTYDSSAVDKMQVTTRQSTTVLEKIGGKWMITAPSSYVADASAVASAVGKGKDLELSGAPISDNPEKQGLYQVDSSGTLVTMYAKGNEVAAFRVGKASQSFTENFVRKEGSKEVHLAKGILSYVFDRPLKDWRDKTIFTTEQSGIMTVKFQYGDTTFALGLQDSVWKVDGAPTVESNVKSFLSAIATLQTDDFIDSAVAPEPKLASMIEVAGTQIRLYNHKDAGKYYVQTSASQQWYEIQGWRADQILKRKKDFAAEPPK